ncbi:MAG: hypothetical protein H0W72_03945 [Planctomycetes bacterium]|nr:hypothetical protein [Planctomycetota bacterium]
MRVIVSIETIVQAWQVEVDLGNGAVVVRCEHRTVATAQYDGDGRWSQIDPLGPEVRQILSRATREIARFDAVLRDARTAAMFPR